MFKVLFISFLLVGVVNLYEVSYYEILGVTKQASTQDIRQAYKKLAIKLHPDKNPNEEEREKFLKITEAYETLKDTEKRRQYDIYGKTTSSGHNGFHSRTEYNNMYFNGLYHDSEFVVSLSENNFDQFLQEGFYFINFYSPFCGPCQKLSDDWKLLAEKFKGIVKVGAMNCKLYNSFCYHNRRISSYPTLMFYPKGKLGYAMQYKGERSFEGLEQFIMNFLKSSVQIRNVRKVEDHKHPTAYVVRPNILEDHTLMRIAYKLLNIVTLVSVDDDDVRKELTNDDEVIIVLRTSEKSTEVRSTDERDILKDITKALPRIETVNPEKLKRIRDSLRAGSSRPWVLFFSTASTDRLPLYQIQAVLKEASRNSEASRLNIGEIDCDKQPQLCLSLQMDSSFTWAVFKQGGAYQKILQDEVNKEIILTAIQSKMQTLSVQEFERIINGEAGNWALLVIPYRSSHMQFLEAFTDASFDYSKSDIDFGIISCNEHTNHYCRRVASSASVVVQTGTKAHRYNGGPYANEIVDFFELVLEFSDLDLTETQVMDVMHPSNREQTWFIAYFPPDCGAICEKLLHELRIVAKKVRPLDFLRVGVLRCTRNSKGFCVNVRSVVAKLYPIASGHHYTVDLRQLEQSAYILEWLFTYLDDSVQKLNWNSFSKTVIAEELHPTSDKKPWLVYFHSPRCYHCYEMYADFAMAGIFLNNAVNLGKINCLNEQGLCRNEQIRSYPSLKLYLSRNKRNSFSSVITIPVTDYTSIIQHIRPHLQKYDENLLFKVDSFSINSQVRHDEF